MSQPNPKGEYMDWLYQEKKKIADKLGMIFTGNDDEGNPKFVGEYEQWQEYMKLLDQLTNDNLY